MNRKHTNSAVMGVTVALALAVRAVVADTSVSYTGGNYVQNFNSLWTNNTTPPVNLQPGLAPIQIGTAVNTPIDLTGPSADFTTTIPAISTMNGWWAINFGGNSNPLNYNVSNGNYAANGTAGSAASVALTAFYNPNDPINVAGTANNMSLGALTASETGNVVFGVKLVNNSTSSLNAISLSYAGQLFHQDTGAKTLAFGYLIDPTNSASIPTSGQTTYGALNVGGFATGPDSSVATAGMIQNLSVSNLPLSSVWAPGQALWLTWQMGVGGGGQGIGIDNLSFSASNVSGSPTLLWAVGNGTWDNVTPNWTGAATTFTNGSNNASFGTIAVDTTVSLQAAGVNAASSVTFNNNGTGSWIITGGGIGGAAASVNINGGTVKLLSTSNSYGLATNVNAGTLIVDNNAELGGANAALNLNGGALKLAGALSAGTRVLTVTGTGGTFNTNGFTATFGATSASVPVIHGALHVTGGGNLNLGIQPTFGNANASAGSLQIDAGTTVTLTGNTRASATDMWDGGVINGVLLLNTTQGARFNFDSVGTFNTADGTNTGVNGTQVVSGTGEIDVPQGSKWTAVSGKGQLDSNGVVISNTSGALGAKIAVNIHLNSAEGSDVNHPAFTRTDVSNPNFFNGSVVPAGNFMSVIGGTKNNGSTGKGGIGAGFSNLLIGGVISGNSDINIGNDYKSGGSGNVTLLAHNTYHGVTMLNGGGIGTPVLYIGIDNALPTDTDVVFGTLSGAGTPSLDLNGHSQVIQSLSAAIAANSPNLNQINNSGATPATLTISGAITPAYPYSGQINDLGPTGTDPLGGNITSTGGSTTALVKDGTSTFVLGIYLDNAHTNISTYSGGTTVKGGILQIPFDGALGAASGKLTFDGGTVSVKAPDLLYGGATGETSITWTSNRPLVVTSNGGTINTPSFSVLDSSSVSHSLVESVIFTGNATGVAYNWAGSLSLSGAAGSAMVFNGGTGSVTVNTGATIVVGNAVTFSAGGAGDPFTDSAVNTKHVSIQNSGSFVVATGNKAVGSLTGTGSALVATGSTLSASQIVEAGLQIGGSATIRAGGGLASKVSTLTISNLGGNFSGKLDITDGKLIVQGTDAGDKTTKLGQLKAALLAGASGGTWTGNGITSSTAAGNASRYGVGLFDNGVLGLTSFGGTGNVNANSILISLAHLGDANRNGVVDIQDLTIVANNWQQSRTNWAAGDLNLDGIVDIQDFTIVANNWQQTSSFSETASTLALGGEVGGIVAAVPEPASVALLALGGVFLMKRRRK